MRFHLGCLFAGAKSAEGLVVLGARGDVPHLVCRIARIEYLHLINEYPVLHSAIRALDETVFVDSRKTRKRGNQPDIRAFRRLDRADPAIMRRVYVTNLETGALTRQPAWSKRGQAPFV